MKHRLVDHLFNQLLRQNPSYSPFMWWPPGLPAHIVRAQHQSQRSFFAFICCILTPDYLLTLSFSLSISILLTIYIKHLHILLYNFILLLFKQIDFLSVFPLVHTVPSTDSGSVSISLSLHGLMWKLKTVLKRLIYARSRWKLENVIFWTLPTHAYFFRIFPISSLPAKV